MKRMLALALPLFVSCGLVAVGVWLISPAVAFMVAGALLAALSLLLWSETE